MKKSTVKDFAFITVGTLLIAVGYSVFIVPYKISGGGLSGISAIIYNFTLEKTGWGFPAGIGMFILNIPLFAVAFKSVGKQFFFHSLVGLILLTGFIELTMRFQEDIIKLIGHDGQPPEILLCCLYAGLLSGLGAGCLLRVNASSGGSGVVGRLVNQKRPDAKIGQIILAFDFLIVLANAIVFQDFSLVLYSVIILFVTSVVTDFVLDGVKEGKAFYIISDKYVEIADEVLHRLNRGVTNITARGMYTKDEKHMLLVLVGKRQQTELKNIIKSVDPAAFMFLVSAKEVLGEGFYPLNSPKEKPKGSPKENPTKTTKDKEEI